MDDDEKVYPSTMISLILLNRLTSSVVHFVNVHVNVWDILSIMQSSNLKWRYYTIK